MSYSPVSRIENGREAFAYAEGGEDGKGHNGNEVRNRYVGTVNMMPGIPYADQMQPYWDKARRNHKTQLIMVLQSFSKKEFNPDNPADILTVNMLGQEFVREHYPGRQAVVFTQTDGKSGLIHNHILINDVSLENGKGCNKEQYWDSYVQRWTEEITQRYTTLDRGEKADDKRTRYERVLNEQGKWSWKDDLRDRVTAAMSQADDEQSFLDNLSKNGVEAQTKDQKKHGHFYTYTLTDFSRMPEGTEQPKRAHARSYSLGAAYGYEALMDLLKFKGKSKSQESTGGSTLRQQADTEEEQQEVKLDFVPFTQKMLLPEEQWAITRADGSSAVDNEKYDAAKQMHEKYLRGEPYREEPKHERPNAGTAPILQQKARSVAKHATEGKAQIERRVKRDGLSEVVKRIEEACPSREGLDFEW